MDRRPATRKVSVFGLPGALAAAEYWMRALIHPG